MRRVHAALFLLSALLVTPGLGWEAGPKQKGFRLYRNLPRDPLVVVAVPVESMPAKLDDLLGFLQRFETEEASGGLIRDLGVVLGLSRHADVLRQLGPEISYTLDLPPLDQVVRSLVSPAADGRDLASVFGRCGILARVRSQKQLALALNEALSAMHAEVREEQGAMRVTIPSLAIMPDEPQSSVVLYYARHRDRFALGFTHEWVTRSVADQPDAETLAGGADFARVFAQLDAHPSSLTYINLPKLHELMVDSRIMGAILAGQSDSQRILAPLFDPVVMEVGFGSTSVVALDGVRTIHFGPRWISGAEASDDLLATMTRSLAQP